MNTIEQQVTNPLKEEGFGILTEIDVQTTIKEILGIDQRPYKVLGACYPSLAHQALQVAPDIGLLLPCNIVVARRGKCFDYRSFYGPQISINFG